MNSKAIELFYRKSLPDIPEDEVLHEVEFYSAAFVPGAGSYPPQAFISTENYNPGIFQMISAYPLDNGFQLFWKGQPTLYYDINGYTITMQPPVRKNDTFILYVFK